MSRPDWETYFLDIAATVATRADCSRRQVGAVIVKDKRIVATGYNGAPAGGPSCLAGQCPRGQSNVASGSSYDTGAGACIANHAEANALLWSARADRADATVYITCPPCDGCARLIAGSGLARVVYPDPTGATEWVGYDVGPIPPLDLLATAAEGAEEAAVVAVIEAEDRTCVLCGKDPADGLASISTLAGTSYYCHGDEDYPSCYELASRTQSGLFTLHYQGER